jgi:5'-methylthioadenosine phosphorylase
MEHKIGIIGGSGIYRLESGRILKEHKIKTPFGPPSDSIFEVEADNIPFFFLPRHGRNHHLLPSEINYCANIFALKKLGVKYLVSTSMVGSLKEEIFPRHFVIPHQFIDLTKGKRRNTFFGEGIVAHVSNANPINIILSQLIADACQKHLINHNFGGTYICIEGPQFSTISESKKYQGLGGDYVGMTNVPESNLSNEAGIKYASLGMVTDFDSWRGSGTPFKIIMENLNKNKDILGKLLPTLLRGILENPPPTEEKEIETSILTPPSFWSKKHKRILEILLK